MKVIYLNVGLSSVFQSQVIDLLNYMEIIQGINEVHLCYGYMRKTEKSRIQKLADHFGIQVSFFKVYPNFPFFNSINRYSLRDAISQVLADQDNTLLHVRGELLALWLNNVLRRINFPLERVLVDIRGSGKEEILEFNDFHYLIKKLKVYNYKLALKSLVHYKFINTVSTTLREYILDRTNVHPENVSVISSFAGIQFSYSASKREIFRQKLGILPQDVLFIVSSGGTGLWQNNEVSIELADLGYKVLNLSKNIFSHPNIINKYVSYNDVPGYLAAADIAVIIRKKSTVNEVASPVKFSEYICSGLSVISNESIKLVADYISDSGYGIKVASLKDITPDTIQRLTEISREDIANYGCDIFGLRAVVIRYMNIYRRMLN